MLKFQVIRGAGGGGRGYWGIFPFSQQNFPCVPEFPKSISSILLFPAPLNYAFVPVLSLLFSFCFHVP